MHTDVLWYDTAGCYHNDDSEYVDPFYMSLNPYFSHSPLDKFGKWFKDRDGDSKDATDPAPVNSNVAN